jgi:hypothetical protein
MEKKKNHPTRWYERLWDSWLNTLDDLIFLKNIYFPFGRADFRPLAYVLVVAVFYFLSAFLCEYVRNFSDTLNNFNKINQMQYWELPEGSEFVSFDSYKTYRRDVRSYGVAGELMISSLLPREEIAVFYETHYPEYHSICLNPVSVSHVGTDTNGQNLYHISAISPDDCI